MRMIMKWVVKSEGFMMNKSDKNNRNIYFVNHYLIVLNLFPTLGHLKNF